MVNRIKLARIERNLTQQQLAEAVGVTRQTINLIEKGKYNPTLKLCLAICHCLNKTLDELFWIEEEKI
ncbi:MAG: putative transcriptional regulator [Tepidanaerobacteraceae bacterium]|nr:putative transcriptional regulator [Tepidanaerobacteraceae bacterium]